ncbi:hypothetical protein AwDysgo_16690 [Bacteroidales bacterium]|nr:hypothetical protein AwDysgo_16690 [Bacteroidales bacterium]
MNTKLKPIATSIYTFEDLINDNLLYVDKTEYIYTLVNNPDKYLFLSRPVVLESRSPCQHTLSSDQGAALRSLLSYSFL